MTNTQFLDIIRAMSPDERIEFARFLSFEVSNKGLANVYHERLYTAVMEAAPDFSGEKLLKHRIYETAFPNKEVVPGRVDKLMSELNKLLRHFVLMKRGGARENIAGQLEWLSWLRERAVNHRFQQLLPKIREEIDENREESLNYYKNLLALSEEEHEWKSTNNKFDGDLGIPALIHSLDLYYLNYRTEIMNRYLLQQKALKLSTDEVSTMEAWNTFAVQAYQEESPLLRVTRSIHNLLRDETPTQEAFHAVMLELQKVGDRFSGETLAQYYAYLRSYCTQLVDGGLIYFITTLHLLHKDNLQRGILLSEGKIGPNAYLNITLVALRAKDFDWAFAFIEQFRTKMIGLDDNSFFYQLALANCLFSSGQFEAALAAIPETPSSSFYHPIIRRLELKIHYEQQSDLLTYKMDAFRKFIERTATKMISPEFRAINIEFANILLQLSQSPIKDAKRSAQLIKRIQDKKVVGERFWLLEKAKALA